MIILFAKPGGEAKDSKRLSSCWFIRQRFIRQRKGERNNFRKIIFILGETNILH